jgi:Flp pilus assembly protein TadD
MADRIEQAIKKDANKPALLINLAAVRRLQGRQQDAIKLLRQASTCDGSDSLVLNNLAWLLAMDGKADEALETVQRAIAMRGEQSNLLDTRAVAYISKAKYSLAINDLQEAIAETPTAHRYFHLAQAYLGAKNGVAARDALRRGKDLGLNELSVDPLERPAYLTLTQIDRQ